MMIIESLARCGGNLTPRILEGYLCFYDAEM